MIVKINNTDTKKRVLVAPLDWGLGHATRCVPIVQELLAQGYEVILAGEKATAALMQNEFPTLKILPLDGYNVQYSKNNWSFLWKMILQYPKIKKAINYEHAWLNNIIAEHKIDIVISDNRFGLYNKKVKSIFITHQLEIQTGTTIGNKIAQKINYRYINKFDECWVPDTEGENNVGGILSHPKNYPNTKVKYIGPLSRLGKLSVEKNIDVAIILSGPEPQRSIFENTILEQIKNVGKKIVLVRGLPLAKNNIITENKNITISNHLLSNKLSALIQSSKIVISRSGYSTVMDLAALQQPAIFVPTPGQTEQEYLAKYLENKSYCMATTQAEFDLQAILKKVESFNFANYPTLTNSSLGNAVASL